MIIFIRISVLFSILLIDVSLINAKGGIVKPGTIVKNVAPILPEFENYANLEVKLENITDMANLYQLPESERNDVLKKLLQNPEVRTITEECKKFQAPPVCSDNIYRSEDGSCNNLKYPEWGKSITEPGRLLPANYEGTNGFRKSESGEDLPSARSISLTFTNTTSPSSSVSALFTFFGQFLTHDISMTPEMSENGKGIKCCDPSKKSNPFCKPADVLPDDPFFSKYNVTCLSFTRAVPYPKCNFAEKRGAINKQTSFFDASHVYGYSKERLKKLRENDGTGRLRTQDTKYGKLMPKNNDKDALHCPVSRYQKCFEGGDDRTNQHTMLLTLETIFLRLHNNIADSLHKLNPNWDDDKVFQESRRILVAMFQHIVYGEYLPLLLGPEVMEKYDLYPDFQRGSLYNDEVKPSVLAEFSAAAFRPHSMVPKFFSSSMPRLKFRHSYSYFRPIHRGQLDSLLVGAHELPSENNDEFQYDELWNYLYKAPGETYGGDMTVTDILRGRDVGLPTYTQLIQLCFNGLQVQDFSHLSALGLMTEKNADELKDIYKYVGDIDALIGILREIRGNAVFGPTASCIAAIQFYRLKYGDSFYFTHINGRNPFRKEQLESLRTYSLARIICETTKVEKVRRNPLMIPSANNPLVMCTTFSPMNLMPWKEYSS